jgi:hypothetical protein
MGMSGNVSTRHKTKFFSLILHTLESNQKVSIPKKVDLTLYSVWKRGLEVC